METLTNLPHWPTKIIWPNKNTHGLNWLEPRKANALLTDGIVYDISLLKLVWNINEHWLSFYIDLLKEIWPG